jgi:hypothetical protein
VLRAAVAEAASQAAGEVDFFARLRGSDVLVRERFSEVNPGEVTGYAVTLPGCTGPDRAPRWYGGGRLHGSLALPRLRARWAGGERGAAECSGAFRISGPERVEIYRHVARQAAVAAEHLRWCAAGDLGSGTDAAWAVADTLHAAAQATGNRVLRCAADRYDRAARAPHRQVPRRTCEGDGLRSAARLLAITGTTSGDGTDEVGALARNLVLLVEAVAGLRAAQEHAAQAAAARQAAEHMHAALIQARERLLHPGRAAGQTHWPGGPTRRTGADFPVPVTKVLAAATAAAHEAGVRPGRQVRLPPSRARPGR